jgi:hypothetical protein
VSEGWIEVASVLTVRNVPKRVEVRLSDEEKMVLVSAKLLPTDARVERAGRRGERGGGTRGDVERGADSLG